MDFTACVLSSYDQHKLLEDANVSNRKRTAPIAAAIECTVKFLHAVAAILLLTPPAWATDLPRYDPPEYCKAVSEFGGGSAMIYNGCMQMEQEAYDSLKRIWNGLPGTTKQYCDEVARFGDRSYAILKGCTDMESEAASSAPEFKF